MSEHREGAAAGRTITQSRYGPLEVESWWVGQSFDSPSRNRVFGFQNFEKRKKENDSSRRDDLCQWCLENHHWSKTA